MWSVKGVDAVVSVVPRPVTACPTFWLEIVLLLTLLTVLAVVSGMASPVRGGVSSVSGTSGISIPKAIAPDLWKWVLT